MTEPRYRPESYQTDFNIGNAGVRYSAACPGCGGFVWWIAKPSAPLPTPICDCYTPEEGAA